MVETSKDSTPETQTGDQTANKSANKSVDKLAKELAGKVREAHLIYLLPEEIVRPEELNVRPWSTRMGITEEETDAIERLAATIAEEGQTNAIKVRVGKDGKYEVIDGNRRIDAIALINAGKSAKESPTRVMATVTDEPIKQAHAFRQAAISNIQRATLSPMDFAEDIFNVKTNVKGFATPKTLAEYFGVSTATIGQYSKLRELPEDLQLMVHKGELKPDAAFVLVGTVRAQEKAGKTPEQIKEKVHEVLAQAAELQKVEKEAAVTMTQEEVEQATADVKKKKRAPKETGTVKARHVREAARSTPEATDKPQPLTKKEILDWFEESQGPVYGYPSGSIHAWLRAFVKWAAGELSDRTMENYFKAMVVKSDRGKPEPKTESKPEKEDKNK